MFVAGAAFASDAAERLYKAGQRAERAGDTLHAYLLYARAAALDPANITYAARMNALKALAEVQSKTRLDPGPAGASSTPAEAPARRELLPPIILEGSPGLKTFDLKGDARTIFDKVAVAYGLQVVFEADYPASRPFTFRMTDVGYRDALRALETVTNSFLVPVSRRLALVVTDTPQKRAALEPAMSLEIPIPQRMAVQDAQELMTAVQQTLDIRRIGMDPLRRMVTLRDQVTKVNAARRMFANLSRLRPQIEVDVDLLDVDRNSSLAYGLSLPNQFSLVDFGHFMNNTPGISSGFTSFLTFGGGSTFVGLGITEASAFATVSKNSSINLLSAQIVSLDGQPATLHVGSRYPIIVNGYYGSTTGTGQVYAPPPTINYEDLGLVVKVTPVIHEDDVTLDLDTSFEVLGAASAVSGIPIINTRKLTGKVRLRDGEWAVIAGLMQLTDSDTRTGILGLSSVPFLGRVFSQNNIQKDSSEVLLVLKPHLVSLPPWDTVTEPVWVGTETRPITQF